MDLTTLLTVAGLFLSIVAGNAAIFGESLFASITVPKTVETAGFDKATAERLFAAEMAGFTKVETVLPTPTVSTSSTPSFAMALAQPLQLQGVVQAIQAQIRQDVVSTAGAIVHEGTSKSLSMVMVVHMPPDPPVTVTINQPDGDVRALISKTAREAMILIAPYRVALTDLAEATAGNQASYAKAQVTAERGLTQPWDPRVMGATELVLLRNLLGVLAIQRRDGEDARRHLRYAHATAGAMYPAYGLVWMNHAFLALTERKTAEAQAAFEQGAAIFHEHRFYTMRPRLLVLEALIAWQGGDVGRAERLFREAAERGASEVEPYYYLSRIAAERGDMTAVETLTMNAHIASRFDHHYAALAHTILPIDVKTGAFIPGAFLPDRVLPPIVPGSVIPSLSDATSAPPSSSGTSSISAPAAAAAAAAVVTAPASAPPAASATVPAASPAAVPTAAAPGPANAPAQSTGTPARAVPVPSQATATNPQAPTTQTPADGTKPANRGQGAVDSGRPAHEGQSSQGNASDHRASQGIPPPNQGGGDRPANPPTARPARP